MLAKDKVGKSHEELIPQNQKNQNEKTVMVTTWHPAMNYLSKIIREKYYQHIENDIYLKKVFPENPIIAFRKKKSIRNYIIRTDINEANEQQKPKIRMERKRKGN